jgi:enoyl-CoA hydratase
MANEAKIGLPEIKLGIFPGGGGSQRLMRQLPMCQAKLLMFTGDFLNAEEALAMGLVNQAVPRAQLLEETMKLAARRAGACPQQRPQRPVSALPDVAVLEKVIAI